MTTPDDRAALTDNPPFGNCRYKICDLPGQCRDEGHCHHPATGERGASQPQPVNRADGVPAGWTLSTNESDGRAWLTVRTPHGAECSLSAAATIDEGRGKTIAAQVLNEFGKALKKDRADGDAQTKAEYIATLPADWHVDSSLETWFPISAEELESTKRMFIEACSALGLVSEKLGIDADEAGGAAPILEAIGKLTGDCESCIDGKCVTGNKCVTLGRADGDAVPVTIDEDDLVLVPRGLIGSALAAIRLKKDAPVTCEKLRTIVYASTSADGDAVPVASYRRGVREAFDLANMINSNRIGNKLQTAEETCACIVRSLAELANGGAPPASTDAVPVAINQHIERLAREVEVECLAGSGVSFYMVAEMAIERTIEMLMDQSMQVAEVCQDADGFKHIEAVIEELDDIPAGTRLYLAAPIASALPAQDSPYHLQQAARYRWLRRKVSAHGVIDGWAFGFPTHLSLPAPAEAMRNPASALDAAIDAAIATAPAMPAQDGVTPEGWRLVPVVPTEEMIEEGCDIEPVTKWNSNGEILRERYKAMIAAAPALPAAAVPVVDSGVEFRVRIARLLAEMHGDAFLSEGQCAKLFGVDLMTWREIEHRCSFRHGYEVDPDAPSVEDLIRNALAPALPAAQPGEPT